MPRKRKPKPEQEPSPPIPTPATESDPPLKRWRVSVPYILPAEVEAHDADEAVKGYFALRGILSTEHKPDVLEIEQ